MEKTIPSSTPDLSPADPLIHPKAGTDGFQISNKLEADTGKSRIRSLRDLRLPPLPVTFTCNVYQPITAACTGIIIFIGCAHKVPSVSFS